MSRTTVTFPDEISVKSLSTPQLMALAADAEIPTTNVPEEKLRRMMLTALALFDGRQFNVPRKELIELHDNLFGEEDLINVATPYIALENAFYFWPGIEAPVAHPSADPATGAHPLIVSFTETSSGHISRVEWDFGDGEKAYTSSVKHKFAAAGTYTVTLTVSNPYGSDSDTLSITVT
jgi:PKD repeat protein